MKHATVRDLRNRYTCILGWVKAGEEVLITQRGAVVARLSPANSSSADEVDWGGAPEVLRDRRATPMLSADESARVIHEAAGQW